MLCRLLCALLFLAWTAEAPNDSVLYSGYWRSPFEIFAPLFVSIPGINLWAWQVLLLAAAPLCLASPGAFRRREWMMDGAILVSLGSVAVTFMWGWMRGGSTYNAYYQLWRFLVALFVGLLVPSVVRGARDLRALGFTIVVAAVARGALATYFFWAHVRGKIEPPPAHMTTHDDSLLFVAGVLVVGSWALARSSVLAWLTAAVVSTHLVYAIILNDRRIAWVELLLVFVALYMVLPWRGRLRRRVDRFTLVAVPVLLVYVAVGWGREGALFRPLRAVSTVIAERDDSSLARQEEIRNLLYTFSAARNPLFGTGWGVEYEKVTSVYANFDDTWWQYRYLPHNSLLGVAVYGGFVGIFGIWLVVPMAAFLAARGYRAVTRPSERAAAMAALCILPAYSAQCYGDVGLQSFTCSLILGVAIGVAGKVSALAASAPHTRTGRRARRLASVSLPSPLAVDQHLAPSAPTGQDQGAGSWLGRPGGRTRR
jgi:hypothetical protein